MSEAVALVRFSTPAPLDVARSMIVLGSAAALILAGEALPRLF